MTRFDYMLVQLPVLTCVFAYCIYVGTITIRSLFAKRYP
jgi:hypothetical protein